MIAFACPECGRVFEVPDEDEGRKVRCQTCGCVMSIPAPGADAVPLEPAPRESPAKSKKPSWFFGMVLPVLLVAAAIWFGFIQQNTLVPHLRRVPRGSWAAQGPAAVWAGIADITLAVTLHAGCFWARIRRFRVYACVLVGVGVAAFLTSTFVAMAKHERALDDGLGHWENLREVSPEKVRQIEERHRNLSVPATVNE